jgi:DNA polymerase elongation subunit (family B)
LTPNIFVLDVETAPLEVYSWGLWKVNVGLNQIIKEWSLLSFATKKLGDKTVLYQDNRGALNVRDDYLLMEELWEVIDEADIVIAQNGKKFDMKRINARFAMLGFPPPSPVRVIDTLLEARRTFGFTSNKLEWLSSHLTCEKKSQHKKFPGFELWAECLKDNQAAWNEMKKYNVADVVATEQLYLKLRPWIDRHPNVAAYSELECEACPKCGSADIQYRGTAYTNAGTYNRIRCNECLGWSRARANQQSKDKRRALLV